MAPKQRKAGSVKTLPDRNEQRVLDLSKKEIDVRVKRWNAFVAAQLANPQQRFVMENFLRANAKIEEFMTVPCSHGHAHKPDCKVCNAELYDLDRRAEAIGFSLDMQKEPPPDDPIERREWIMSLRSQTVSDLNYVALSTGEPSSELIAKSPYVQWCDIELELLDAIAGNLTAETETPSNTAPLFVWKGTPPELFALFEELVGKGWVQVPTNRGKRSRDQLARNVHSAFAYASGTTLKVGTAVNYLKKGSDGVNEQRPEPRVPFTLKRNPDVGENYDPDKAGE